MCLFSWWIDCGVNESVPLLSKTQTELVMIRQRWLSSRSCPSQTVCELSFIFCSARYSVALTPVTLMTRLRDGERRRVACRPDRESTEPEEQCAVKLVVWVWLFSSEPFRLFKKKVSKSVTVFWRINKTNMATRHKQHCNTTMNRYTELLEMFSKSPLTVPLHNTSPVGDGYAFADLI